jgi:hypothetical protein
MAGTSSVLEGRLHLSCSHGRTVAAAAFMCAHVVLHPGTSAARQTLLTSLHYSVLCYSHCLSGQDIARCCRNIRTFRKAHGASIIKIDSSLTLKMEENVCSETLRKFHKYTASHPRRVRCLQLPTSHTHISVRSSFFLSNIVFIIFRLYPSSSLLFFFLLLFTHSVSPFHICPSVFYTCLPSNEQGRTATGADFLRRRA